MARPESRTEERRQSHVSPERLYALRAVPSCPRPDRGRHMDVGSTCRCRTVQGNLVRLWIRTLNRRCVYLPSLWTSNKRRRVKRVGAEVVLTIWVSSFHYTGHPNEYYVFKVVSRPNLLSQPSPTTPPRPRTKPSKFEESDGPLTSTGRAPESTLNRTR